MDADFEWYFIYKYSNIKFIDLRYKYKFEKFFISTKFKINHSQNTNIKFNTLLPKVRVLVSFINIKHFKVLNNVKILSNFLHQLFRNTSNSKIKFFKFNFGLKNMQEMYWFLGIYNTSTVNSFFLFLPSDFKKKLFPIGIFGKQFFYLRYLILDIFNFFEAEFFQSFYLSYFDCQAVFSIDISNIGNNLFFNWTAPIDYKLSYLQSLYSFFKILSHFFRI